jgi:6-phosphogluconolactonase
MSEVIVERYADSEALVAATARRLVAAVVSAQADRGSASVVLTGGGTGIGVLKAVRADPGGIDWSAIDIYWGDERFVPYDDPERNELQAREALLDHVDVDASRVHPMAASDGEFGDDPAAAAAAYADIIEGAEFDVHLLGMGGEGHINSLFPHSDAVREKTVSVVAVTDSPKPPPVRVTLTLPAVQRSKQVWLIVSGDGKAEAVAAAVGGADSDDWPSAGARGTEATVWLVDEAAASKL